MSRRNTWRFFDYQARCRGCEWELYSKNALGVAAQHHDRTGHSVDIEVSGCVSYLSEAEHEAALEEKAG